MKSHSSKIKDGLKPLLEREKNLIIHKNFLLIKPIHHILCGILFEGSAYKGIIRPRWFVTHLYEHKDTIGLKYSRFLPNYKGKSGTSGAWNLNLDGVFFDLIKIIENKILPIISNFKTINDHNDFVNKDSIFRFLVMRNDIDRQAIIEAALGNFDLARDLCLKIKHEHTRLGGISEDCTRLLTELAPPLFADDKAGVGAVLHRWEEYTVKACGLEKHWQKTPFPFEEGGE